MFKKESPKAFRAHDMKNWSVQSDGFSTKERLKICLKLKYQPRILKNKGAIMVLTWGFFIMSVYYYIDYQSLIHEKDCSACFYIVQISMSLVLPFAGWLADVCFGRYRVIYWSTWAMWISSVLITAYFIAVNLVQSFHQHYHVHYILFAVLAIAGAGFGGFQANIIQFGVDQLTDASTIELVSFINWYACAFLSSGAVTHFIPRCTTLSDNYKIIAPFLLSASLSVLVISILLCNKVLIKEPVTRNPFTLIIKVVKYALKHEVPQQRSAFTYCEDVIPSRLDCGKRKYGGPFTTEQVEDVKTFFGMLGMILIVGSVFGITDEEILKVHLDKAVNNQTNGNTGNGCLSSFIFTNIYYITGVLLIPLNEIIIYPLFHRCLPSTRCYWKVMIGVILHFGRYITLIVLITVAQRQYVTESTKNVTIQCLFNDNLVYLNKEIDYRWFAIPQVLSAISFILIIIGTIEFYCAQVPYSMKGVVSGIFYGTLLLFRMLSNGLPQLFGIKLTSWNLGLGFGCEFWYLQVKVYFLLIAGLILLVLLKYYKKRKREDILPNEHIFAERYYDSSS